MKIVKVARVGSKVCEVVVQSSATIEQCLSAAGIKIQTNEDVFENHVLRDIGTNALVGAIIVVEQRKRLPLSYGLTRFINHLLEEEILDEDDYIDDNDNIDINNIYDDNKEFIDGLISKAKEA